MNFPRVEFKLINRDNGSSIILNDTSGGGTFYAPPIGWDESETVIKRSMDNYGVFTSISTDLEFVTEGASFLRLAYQSRRTEANVDLEEYRFNPHTDVKYLLNTQTFDFSEYSSTETKVSIPFKTGGLNAIIQSSRKEKYELERETSLNGIPISPVEKQDVALVSREILLISELETISNDSLTESFRMNFGSGNYREGHVGIPLSINYESDDMITPQIKNQFEGSLTEGLASMVFYLNNDIKKDLHVKFNLKYTGVYRNVSDLSNDAFFRVVLETYENGSDLDIVTSKRRTLFEIIGDGNIVTYFFEETTTEISFDEVITLEEGESLSLQWYGGANFGGAFDSGRFDVDFKDVSCKINIDEDSVRPNSQTQSVLMGDAGEQLLKIFTGDNSRYESEFFTNGDFKFCSLTLGLWIRRFFDRNIEISWDQFIDNSNSLFLMGYTIEKIDNFEKVIHEPIDYFFQKFVSVEIEKQVSQVVRYPLTEETYSSIKMGYKKPSGDNLYEEAQGLDEPNILNSYNTPIVRVENDYDKTSDFRADSYGKEFARRQLNETDPTKDTRYDKSIFVLDLKETSGDLLTERTWPDDFETEPENVYSPDTITNLRLSPLNNLLRHGKVIRSFTNLFREDSITFNNGVGNVLLKTQPSGGVERAENDSILINDLDFPLFENEVIEFKSKVTFDVLQQLYGKTLVGDRLVQNFFGKVRFVNEFGEKEDGYILEVQPNKEGNWKLIKAA